MKNIEHDDILQKCDEKQLMEELNDEPNSNGTEIVKRIRYVLRNNQKTFESNSEDQLNR